MLKTKEEKGITLIALVITIVILLILVSVSIAMLTGNNGILTQAKLAKENTQAAKEEEENKLSNNNEYINVQTGNAVPGKIVSETKKDNYVDINGDKATVPAGFTVSKISEEQKVSEGLVIYDIPESDIENVEWTTKNEDGAYNVQTLYNQFVWIPVTSQKEYQRNFNYPSSYEKILNSTPADSTYTDIGYLPTGIQPETDNAENNEEVERTTVLKYNGFYIGRYETGKNENGEAISKQNKEIYVNESQEEFKIIGKTMYDKSNIKSAMCSGIQWDLIMNFIDQKIDGMGNVYNVKMTDKSRHMEAKNVSGKNLSDKVQNIYDLEGNCWEYVAEKNNTNDSFVIRSGNYNYYENYPVSVRGRGTGGNNGSGTFRIVLYLI